MGGGNGILDKSVDVEKCIDEFDDEDDDGDGLVILIAAVVVDGSSSIVFDAVARSRSFRTSRTVR